MTALSRKTLFAVEAVLDIAHNSGAGPVRSQDITRRQKIPRRYLEQVLQQLVRASILAGVRGPRGGYVLARERRRISVGDIVRVVSGDDAGGDEAASSGSSDSGGSDSAGSDLGAQVLQPVLEELQQEYLARLDAMTMQELCLLAQKAGVPAGAPERLDYAI